MGCVVRRATGGQVSVVPGEEGSERLTRRACGVESVPEKVQGPRPARFHLRPRHARKRGEPIAELSRVR